MKLIHISDIHIHPEAILGHDPVDNFARCLAHVEANHGDAERIVITGDLTDRGLEQSYRHLQSMLATSSFTGERAPRLAVDQERCPAIGFAGRIADSRADGLVRLSRAGRPYRRTRLRYQVSRPATLCNH